MKPFEFSGISCDQEVRLIFRKCCSTRMERLSKAVEAATTNPEDKPIQGVDATEVEAGNRLSTPEFEGAVILITGAGSGIYF